MLIGYPRIENFLIAEACDEKIAPVGERGIIGKSPCAKGGCTLAVTIKKAHLEREIMWAFAAEAVREDGKAIGAVSEKRRDIKHIIVLVEIISAGYILRRNMTVYIDHGIIFCIQKHHGTRKIACGEVASEYAPAIRHIGAGANSHCLRRKGERAIVFFCCGYENFFHDVHLLISCKIGKDIFIFEKNDAL